MVNLSRFLILLAVACIATAARAQGKIDEIPSPDLSLVDQRAAELANMKPEERERSVKRDMPEAGCYLPNSQNGTSGDLIALRIQPGLLPRNRQVIGCHANTCLTGNIYYVTEDTYFWYYKMSDGPNYKIAIYKSDLGSPYEHYVAVYDRNNSFLFYNYVHKCD